MWIRTLLLLLLPVVTLAQDFSIFNYRNVGPLRGGRVTAVAGTVAEEGTFYLGATGAGVWKTTDYGTSWNNVSDGYFKTPSIGAIAVDQDDPNIVYVGTGTDGLRSNVIVGKGMYKSIDAGKTWEHIGLENVGQIGAVRIHPDNHNVVYVAAIGQPFVANPERGIYKTTDGGKTWNKILFKSNEVGFYDIEMLPGNPETLFATAWKAQRKPWTIISGGSNEDGGIYKSSDGGASWERLSEGLPTGLIGKIDVAVTPADSKIIYALVEAPEKEGGVYKSEDQGKSFELVSSNGGLRTRPFYYTNLRVDPKDPDKLYVLATGYYRSTNGGKSWSRRSSPHGDNHDMWINPNKPDLFIQSNDGGANVTFNGGETWSTQYNQPTSEIYQVEVDDQFPYWLYGGMQDNYTTVAVPSNAPYGIQTPATGFIINTGGCETGPAVPKPGNHNIVYSNCKGRFGVFNKLTGTEKAYYVGAANLYGHNPKDLKHRFQRVSPIHVSPHNPDVVYHTSQYVHKTTNDGKTWETISPDLTAFESDKQVISGSPITRDITGEEYYSTIYAIRESSVKAGVIWTGANDGPVYVTQDGGANWKNVTPKMPSGGRVDAVEPSPHNAAKAYVAVLRYQLGDNKPYIYKTDNYGKSWELLTTGSNGIPADYPTRVVREHPDKEGLLFAGTEYGMFISMDDGKNWKPFQQNLPLVPITDLKIHEGDLVLSTMGRGFWIADDIDALLKYDNQKTDFYVQSKAVRYYVPSGSSRGFSTPNFERPGVTIDYYLESKPDSPLKLEIMDSNGNLVNTLYSDTSSVKIQDEVIEDMNTSSFTFIVDKSLSTKKEMNRFRWDMQHAGPWHKEERRRYQNGPMAVPGEYTAKLTVGSTVHEQKFEILPDPRLEKTNTSMDDVKKQVDFALKVIDLLSNARQFEEDLNTAAKKGTDEEKSKAKNLLTKLREADITYPQPKVIDQMEYLYAFIADADQVPGKDAYDQYDALMTSFENIKNQWK